ncbi:MAG: 4Fe-4S binding protein [Eubacterium sp.]|nr:4Fe-4S binding protein [Eubacterium sp.]MCR5291422.1 4Fe-4S binding protein [Eubacterium sp.]
MSQKSDLSKINEKSPYQDMTEGNQIYGGGGSVEFKTGEWRTETPVMNWEKCVNCLLCAPCCPDSCIPVEDGKRLDFDYDHCKGCGICAAVCSFKAISMKEGL